MKRYEDRDHPDCWIECEGSGTAVYADPPGQCFTSCGEEGLARCLGEALDYIVGGMEFRLSTSIPFLGIHDILQLRFENYVESAEYYSVLDRLQSAKDTQQADAFEFSGETTLIELLNDIADHFAGEQLAEA